MLHDGMPHSAMNLGGQSGFAVKPLMRGCMCLSLVDQAIQRIVAVLAEQRGLLNRHWTLRAFKVRAFEYLLDSHRWELSELLGFPDGSHFATFEPVIIYAQ